MADDVIDKHPDYNDRISEWMDMRRCKRGETAVKSEGEEYLPMPSGFRAQPDNGMAMYKAYIKRAQFPEILSPVLQIMLGIIHRKEVDIEGLPEAMDGIWEKATANGLPLEAFQKRITAELLLTGRYGILTDAPAEGGDLPYFSGYRAENIINWEETFFVLDESGPVRKGRFGWDHQPKYRVLEKDERGFYHEVLDDKNNVVEERVYPQKRGGGALDFIPFVVTGTMDMSLKPSDPPLLGLARASLAAYRLDADYRHQLYMSGQETLFVFNADAPKAVGAGVVVSLRGKDDNLQPDARYVGPSGSGINAHRQAIMDERDRAIAAGSRVFDPPMQAQESGEARELRFGAETATLTTIAQASASALEASLKNAAKMMNLPHEEIAVKPNLDHLKGALSPQDAEALGRLWMSGGISYQTFYENLLRGEIASPERNHEEEFRNRMDEEFETGTSATAPGAQPQGAGTVSMNPAFPQ